jgi:hypothetical protein
MKKLLLFIVLALAGMHLQAQQCTPDSSAPAGFIGLYPLPAVNLDGIASVPEPPACIGEPYEYTFSVIIPASVTIPGVPVPVGITSAEIVGVSGLPAGLSVGNCSPSNCIFVGGQNGCFKISGTPDASNAVGDYELAITLKLNNLVQPLDITYPPLAGLNIFNLPEAPYSIKVREAGQCTSPTYDLSQSVSISDNVPNPFSGTTDIRVDAQSAGDYTFTVYNMLGEKITEQRHFLATGENHILFDGAHLAEGVYVYTLSDGQGQISKKMVVGR